MRIWVSDGPRACWVSLPLACCPSHGFSSNLEISWDPGVDTKPHSIPGRSSLKGVKLFWYLESDSTYLRRRHEQILFPDRWAVWVQLSIQIIHASLESRILKPCSLFSLYYLWFTPNSEPGACTMSPGISSTQQKEAEPRMPGST